MHKLKGRTAIITGAASGMGAAEATRFVEEGANVIIADIDQDAGNQLASTLGKASAFHQLDVCDEEGWNKICSFAEERFGPVEVLVNNAGIIVWGGVSTTSEDTFRRAMDVNCIGAFLGMRAVVTSMRRSSRGSIINVGSTSGMVGSPRSIAYTASKWALRGMTKAAALELAPAGIRVNAIHPGVVDTPMNRGAQADSSGDLTSGLPPIGRLGLPSEVANLALYLASDDSSYTTGADHVIDGGRSAGW